MKTTIIAQNLENGNVKFEFPEFQTSVELHSGKHINSKNNWSAFVPHGNCKKPVEMVLNSNYAKIGIVHRPKVDESKYPNQMRYSMVISGNFGRHGYYISTSDMRISEEMYNKLNKK